MRSNALTICTSNLVWMLDTLAADARPASPIRSFMESVVTEVHRPAEAAP